jgi:hypothetical protein
MDVATLLLLTSSVGVGFGWQPMPDGMPRVEYLVQIEPEMLTSLQAGSTIPIVSEVPEGIGPIGRVRIVIGRQPLPRQNLAQPLETTLHKPDSETLNPITTAKPPTAFEQATATQGGAGVQQTQYSTASPTATGYTQPSSLSSQPTQAQNTPAPALPMNPLGGNTYQKAIEAGERQAAETRGQSVAPTSAPSATGSPSSPSSSSSMTGTPGGVSMQSSSAPGWPSSPGQSPAPPGPVSGPSAAVPSSGSPGARSPENGATSGNMGYHTQQPASIPGPVQGQRLDRAVPGGPAFPTSQTSPTNQTGNAMGQGYATPRYVNQLPNTPSQQAGHPKAGYQGKGNQGLAGQGHGAGAWNAAHGQAMSANNPAATGHPERRAAGPEPGSPGAKQVSQPRSKANLAAMTTSGQSPESASQAATTQLGLAQHGLANNPQTPTPQTPADNPPPGMFSLLLAWVLLFGSCAGNVYLFWSYLDIRGKYQAVIHSHRVPHSQYTRA